MSPNAAASRVLVVENDASLRITLDAALRQRGRESVPCSSAAEALECLRWGSFDVVVTAFALSDMDGIRLIAKIRDGHPGTETILITRFADLEHATRALHVGVSDFLAKPFSPDDLEAAIVRVEQRQRAAPVSQRLYPAVEAGFARIIGSSPATREIVHQLQRIADSDCTVLITGESGTGKDLFAHSLHENGPRAKKPFLAISCAALSRDLLESELFGHAKGAFSGACNASQGVFAGAAGGTLLLDEIGGMPIELQSKFLRVLQERTVRAIGTRHEQAFDTRILAASNIDLERAADEGTFRRDLLYRLDVVRVHLPPLRERREDVMELARHFLSSYAAGRNIEIGPDATARLESYDWPGNVRELESCVSAAVALARDGRIGAESFPACVPAERRAQPNPEPELPQLETVERECIARVLRAVAGNKAAAARILGINRVTLYRKLERRAARESAWRR